MRGVVWDGRQLIVAEDLEVREPDAGEVQVRVLASGICHSDLNVIDRGGQRSLPVVLGHEAAGVVERLGGGVMSLQVGQPVAVGCQTPCCACRACSRGRFTECPSVFGQGNAPFSWRGNPVHSYANSSSFAGLITVRATQLLPADGLSPQAGALVGCAVSTGYGATRNAAEVSEGDTVAVFGVGGIGVNALQTARLLGAARIIAVDVNPAKAPMAHRFGADCFVIAPRGADAAALALLVRDAAGASIDAAIECSGAPVAVDASIRVVGRGGRVALVGIPPDGSRASFDVHDLEGQGQRIIGSLNGSSDPFRDLPEIVRLAQAGKLELEAQVSRIWPLAEVEAAIAAVRAGEVVRAVLDHSL